MFKVDYAVKYNNNEDEKVENWFEGEKPYIDERTGIIAYKVVLGWYTFYIKRVLSFEEAIMSLNSSILLRYS